MNLGAFMMNFLWCMFCFSSLVHCSAVPVDPFVFPIYWNIGQGSGWSYKLNVSSIGILPENYTAVGGGCTTLPHCKRWGQGAWPYLSILRNGTLRPHNGGVPQASNLTHHIYVINQTLPSYIPEDYFGNVVLDFEYWTPVWNENANPGSPWHNVAYQHYSKELVSNKHPSWNSSQVAAQAKIEFEAAAMAWFVETLKACRALRPLAKWGFYGRPANPDLCGTLHGKPICGYSIPSYGDEYRRFALQQIPYFKQSTALYPSIYLPAPSYLFSTKDAGAYVESVVRETSIIANMSGSPPVLPYMWLYHHDGKSLLSAAELRAVLHATYNNGGTGLIIWGESSEARTSMFQTYWNSTAAPMMHEFLQNATACSARFCSSHGRCSTAVWNVVGQAQADCICQAGWTARGCGQLI